MACLPSSEYGFEPHYSQMSTLGTQYYNKLQQFLIFKGKKSRTERLFRNLLISRAQNFKSSLVPELERCKYNSTPYVRLKTRRKGKRILYRINFLENKLAEKQSWSSFGKHLRNQNSEKLQLNLEKEIETLSKERNHPVRVNRDKLHQLARRHAPQRWLKKNIFNKTKKKIFKI